MEFVQDIQGATPAEILLVGNELLNGKTQDLNGFWLGKQLPPFGIYITRTTIIRDDVQEIANTITECLSRKPRYIFTSGGLGPTFDDLTLEGVAKGLHLQLECDQVALSWIAERYEKVHATRGNNIIPADLNDARKKMAFLPSGACPLRNSAGAAPGVLIEKEATSIFILPGVPREMQAIFHDEITPRLKDDNSSIKFYQVLFNVYKVGESTMAEEIINIMKESDPHIWIKSHAKTGPSGYYVEMDITAYGTETFKDEVEIIARRVKEKIEGLGGIIEEEKH